MEETWPCFQEAKIIYHLYKQLVNFLLTGNQIFSKKKKVIPPLL